MSEGELAKQRWVPLVAGSAWLPAGAALSACAG